MKLPSFKRLFTTDFQDDYKDLIDKLASQLNYGIEVLYNALNNNLTLRDNLAASVADIVVTVDSNGVPISSSSFAIRSNLTVEGVLVLNAFENGNTSAPPPGAVFVNFTVNSNQIVINSIKGLTAGVSYRIRLVAIG